MDMGISARLERFQKEKPRKAKPSKLAGTFSGTVARAHERLSQGPAQLTVPMPDGRRLSRRWEDFERFYVDVITPW